METIERFLTNHELHEFAQWFAYHYGNNNLSKEYQESFPREDIINLVDFFIKSKIKANGDNNNGFVKWFAENYEIYGDCKGRDYQIFCKETNWDTTVHKAKNTQEWIEQHFKDEITPNGLIYVYFQDKLKGKIFELHSFDDLKKELTGKEIQFFDECEDELND